MNASLATIVVPFAESNAEVVTNLLERYADPAGAQYQELKRKLEDGDAFMHFMAMTVVPAPKGSTVAHLAIELNADGTERDAIREVSRRLAPELNAILAATGDYDNAVLDEYLERHCVDYAPGWFRQPGLGFVGTPDLTVKRILDEAKLAARIRTLLENLRRPGAAVDKLHEVRAGIFPDPEYKWAFVCEPTSRIVGTGEEPEAVSRWETAAKRFAWPLLIPPVVLGLLFWEFESANEVGAWKPLLEAIACFFIVAVIEVLALGGFLLYGYLRLRREERDDVPRDEEPGAALMEMLLDSEDRPGWVQNHLIAVSRVKPGWVRRFTLRLALALIGDGAASNPRPGFLDRIGSIHFARWVRLRKTDQLLFLSNYDGSWQSYLEDFIARLRAGLTSVWSNTRDFPKTSNLVYGGAGDATRFKRWARRQQRPNTLWYSAYPELTTGRIRTNALIRHGFAAASSEQEAAEWLANFGYAGPDSVEFSEIPTLAFGGLSTLQFAHCLLVTLARPVLQEQRPPRYPAREWLREIQPDLTYGNRKPNAKALVVGFTSLGLAQLALGDEALATFPMAFQQGMSHALRARALGDDHAKWTWKSGDIDAILLVYDETAAGLANDVAARRAQLERHGCRVSASIALAPLPDRLAAAPKPPSKEPFGFTDGVSQPVMRGTVRGSEGIDPLHTVNPGELVLGYRDNLGMVAPAPRCSGRDLGRNGTFLVVRQLAQDANAFNAYLADAADRLIRSADPRIPDYSRPEDLQEWLAAKLVGRWRDGTSLVRNPNDPGSVRHGTPPDNEFLFGEEDPEGLRCPLGAHVRRANPRDSFDPGSRVQIDISNRHRILRVGRVFVDEDDAERTPRGLLFMCVNADIERQFEFLQQSWILGSTFHGLDGEVDPIVGCGGNRCMNVPTPNGPLRLENLAAFVTTLGGGYFFMPGRAAVRYLSS